MSATDSLSTAITGQGASSAARRPQGLRYEGRVPGVGPGEVGG